jgi:hypothetical protein
MIAALKNHRLFNAFGTHNGFWAEDEAPDELKPTVKDQVAAIIAALKADDRKAVEAVLISERSSHNREVVISAGEDALSALKESEQSPEDGGLARPDPRTTPEALKE